MRASFIGKHHVRSILARHYDPSFTTDLCLKDPDLIQSTAAAVGVSYLLSTAYRNFQDARVQYGAAMGLTS